jgi:hypothetical protein
MNVDHKDANKGLYEKFTVTRNDGRSAPGEEHEHCRYFVLDLDHDPHVWAAVRAYEEEIAPYFPRLAIDLMKIRDEATGKP